ncbi:MAG: PorT family protein [Tannerellaceae bacterium]|nr:PorT family protein [Tannerellaceae bacterium]
MEKKIIFIAFLLVGYMSVQAQTTTSFGIKLNTGITNLRLTDHPGKSHTFKPSAGLGGLVRISFNETFALQPELMINYTESSVKWNNEKIKFKYAGVEIPVYAMGKRKVGEGILFAGVGPHIGYGFSIDSRVQDLPAGHPDDNAIELDHWYMGGNVQAGYEFRKRIFLHATYQLSFDLRSSSKSSPLKTQTIAVGVGYRF